MAEEKKESEVSSLEAHFKKDQSQGRLKDLLKELPRSLYSPDGPTRWASLWMFMSFFGVFLTAGSIAVRHWKHDRAVKLALAKQAQEELRLEAKKLEEREKVRSNTVIVGTFSIQVHTDLKPPKGRHVFNLAEVEIVAFCREMTAKRYIEEHAVEARDVVMAAFTLVQREDLLSREGKKRLKKHIQRKLNHWLPEGQIEEIFISKLIIT